MSTNEKLVIVTNERIFSDGSNYFCDNIDIKTILEGLSNKFEIIICCRSSKKTRPVKFEASKVFIINSILKFIKSIFNVIAIKNKRIIYISIHPFSFSFFLFLSLFKKNSFVYLRSNGFKEYEVILGKKWVWIYAIMFKIVTYYSRIISCHDSLAKGKKQIFLNPSELDENWIVELKDPKLDVPELLYVGRLKVEKGIHSLIEMVKNIEAKIKFTIVGLGDDLSLDKVSFIESIPFVSKKNDLINYYDNHNIVVLPSYTEAHPKVVDEALARLRPVIIFDEISHIIGNRRGVFVAKRNSGSLKETIFHIMKNYKAIQEMIKKNKLPTKEKFINDLTKIIKNEII